MTMSHSPSTCHPLTLTRSIPDFPIGNRKLRDHQFALAEQQPVSVDPMAWVEPAEWHAFQESGCSSMVNEITGETILWLGETPDVNDAYTASDSFLIHYPWDLLRANENHVSFLKDDEIAGDLHPAAHVHGVLKLGEGSRILPGVVIEGNVVIGNNCKIGPNCYIRGNTSIGDGCHIGQCGGIRTGQAGGSCRGECPWVVGIRGLRASVDCLRCLYVPAVLSASTRPCCRGSDRGSDASKVVRSA